MVEKRHVCEMCRASEWLLYWVGTTVLRYPAFGKLESGKSISRYEPPKGTAGFARSFVSGSRRLPSPPARMTTRMRGSVAISPEGIAASPWRVRADSRRHEQVFTDPQAAGTARGGAPQALPTTSPQPSPEAGRKCGSPGRPTPAPRVRAFPEAPTARSEEHT